MVVLSIKSFLSLFVLVIAGISVSAQVDASMGSPSDRRKPGEQETKSIGEMLTKQRLLREKKDHEDMLKRGEEALALSQQLEKTFEQTTIVSEQDKRKLADLEKVVTKIRNELGGDDVEDDELSGSQPDAKPSTVREAFIYLHSTTVKLLDELKKTTRFSISAAAIQGSNSILRLVRFLRTRR